MDKELNKKIYEKQREQIQYFIDNPDKITPKMKNFFQTWYSMLAKVLNYSEHSAWGVKWTIEKRNKAGEAPYETLTGKSELAFGGNIILNSGANEMLKLIFGLGGTPYAKKNARILIGDNATSERADQTGILAMSNRVEAMIDSGYPQVAPESRTAIIRATVGEEEGNFAWREISLTNGSIALNRKQKNMGEKTGGVWTVQLEISIVEM